MAFWLNFHLTDTTANCATSWAENSIPRYFADACICPYNESLIPQPLLEVKLTESVAITRLFCLRDLYPYRCSGLLFGLWDCILILAETVTPTPCNIMWSKYLRHLGIVNIKYVTIAPYPTGLFGVPVRNAESSSFIVDKSVKRYFSLRTQVIGKLDCILQDWRCFHA